MSRELIKKADEIISKTRMPDRHSFFQLEKFLIGKECTCQAQLWQITREISTRREAIESLDTQIDETQDSLELIDISIERLKTINMFISFSTSRVVHNRGFSILGLCARQRDLI